MSPVSVISVGSPLWLSLQVSAACASVIIYLSFQYYTLSTMCITLPRQKLPKNTKENYDFQEPLSLAYAIMKEALRTWRWARSFPLWCCAGLFGPSKACIPCWNMLVFCYLWQRVRSQWGQCWLEAGGYRNPRSISVSSPPLSGSASSWVCRYYCSSLRRVNL